MIAEDLGIKLENVTVDMLGTAKRVRIEKENTTIVDGAGAKKDIDGRMAQIKAQIEQHPPTTIKEKLQERLAKLAGGVAVIRVGGATEVEVKEKKDRVEALNATRAAVEEGILPGGGVALLRAAKSAGGDQDRERRPAYRGRNRPQGDAPAGAADRRECRRRRLDRSGRSWKGRTIRSGTTPRRASTATCSGSASSTRRRPCGPRYRTPPPSPAF